MKRWQGVVGGLWGSGYNYNQLEPRHQKREGRESAGR